ncbi:hypothetical protein OV320_1427 [Actinobacteria bacterium OV320]|nr:hypothetical protein OV320_1427 [Actinobacteria bacterium OV320]
MLTVHAHAAPSPGEPLAATTVERRDPGPHDAAQSIVRLLTRMGGMP